MVQWFSTVLWGSPSRQEYTRIGTTKDPRFDSEYCHMFFAFLGGWNAGAGGWKSVARQFPVVYVVSVPSERGGKVRADSGLCVCVIKVSRIWELCWVIFKPIP